MILRVLSPFRYNSSSVSLKVTRRRIWGRTLTTQRTVPRKAQVVICGGGVVGVSTAYHLAARGVTEVVLLERGSLACGTTWHAAGLVGAMRQNDTQTQLCVYSQNLYKWMEENGYPTGYKQCGSINVAATDDRLIELRRAADRCRKNEVAIVELTPSEVKNRTPWINTDDIKGGFWLPTDGAASPTDVCQSLAKMAQEKGARLVEGCEVIRVLTASGGAVSGVETSLGNIQCSQFILCGGMWSRSLASQTIPSVPLPLQPTEHFYLVTQPLQGVDFMTPVFRDADAATYVREWSGGFLVGVFEKTSLPVFPDGPPRDFQFQLLPDNWEHFQPYYDKISHRFPFLKDVEIRHMNNGPESFTPDGTPLLGQVTEVPGFLVACGMNSRGIALGGGVGRTVAEMVVDGAPSLDCSQLDVKRFFPEESTHKNLWSMAKDIVGDVYSLHYPKTAQPIESQGRSPLSHLEKELGAVFGKVNNMEIPLWFSKSVTGNLKGSFGKPDWFDIVQQEVALSQEGLVLADTSALFGALTLIGPSESVERLFVHPVSGCAEGSILHTALLNQHGQYVAQCSLLPRENDRYVVVFPKACERHLVSWLGGQRDAGISFEFEERHTSLALFGPTGQLSAALGSKLTSIKENRSVKGSFGSVCPQLLKCPWLPANHVLVWTSTEGSDTVYQAMVESVSGGVRPVGLYCLDAVRTDEGIPWWGTELNSGTTPLAAGMAKSMLDQEVQLRGYSGGDFQPLKSKDFFGKSALTRGSGIQKSHSLIHFTVEGCNLDSEIWSWGGEPVLVGQRVVGDITSLTYSRKRSAFTGLAVVELERPWDQRKLELLNAGKRYLLKMAPVDK